MVGWLWLMEVQLWVAAVFIGLALLISVDEEQRFVTIGLDALGRILVVVYTYRQETIRLISARRATQAEQRNYEEGI